MKTSVLENLEKEFWDALNLLRGEIRTEQMKHYFVPMNTLIYLSDNNDHPFDIPFTARWENVTAHGIDIGNRLDQAFQEIESRNPSLKGVFTINEFKRINDTVLFKIAETLKKYSFDRNQMTDSDPLTGTFAQYIEKVFELFIQREGAYSGESSSPRDVGELLVQLLQVKNGTIYDGTAGMNDFLIEAYKNARDNGGEVRLFGQELNQQTWSLGKMNLILHGLYPEVAEISLGHTITNPSWKTDNQQLIQFDGIISNPPFGIGNWGHKEAMNDLYGRFRYGVPAKSTGDMAFVQHYIASLKGTGKAALIVPHGVLFRGATEGKIRAEIIKEDLIEAIIGLPGNLFYGTGIPVAVLILNKDKEDALRNKILMISAEGEFEKGRVKNTLRKMDIDKIVKTYANLKEIDDYSRLVDVTDIANNDWNLSPVRYFDKVEIETEIGTVRFHKDRYEQLTRTNLGNIAEVKRGLNVVKNDSEEMSPSHYVINLSDVDKNGTILFENLNGVNLNAKKAKEYELLPGDVLVSSRGTTLKVTVISNTDVPLVFSSNFARIRIYDPQYFSPEFIRIFLDGPVGQYYVNAFQTGSVVTVLSTKDIEQISIPELPIELQQEVAKQILLSDKEYEETLAAAQRKKKEGYIKGYQLMGISDSFEIERK